MTDPRAALRQLWLRNRDVSLGRMERVASALRQLGTGSLGDDERQEARTEAHRLRGILGTYGYAEGSVLAGEAEDILAGQADGLDAAELAVRMEAYAATL